MAGDTQVVVRVGRALLALFLLALPLAGGAARVRAATIAIACGATGLDRQACEAGARGWARASGNRVRVISTPASASARLALYQQFLAARAPDIDVYTIDVVWPGLLGADFVDLSPYVSEERRAGFAPALLANDVVGGRLVALPWFADAGVLFYREDLLAKYRLEVPRSWAELAAAAETIQRGERADGDARFWGYVWQGRAYEGLACNALEWIASSGGGRIVAADGRVDVDNPRAAAALEMARGWVGRISPPGVLNYGEEEARGLFQSGHAAFMRNWPYAWALGQGADSAVRGRIGVAPLPAGPGGESSGVLGGAQLAVSRYSRHARLAAELVLYLTSAAEQKRRAIAYAYSPTLPALYEDRAVLAANPFLARLRPVFARAIARPSAVMRRRYNEASADFFTSVHAVLAGEAAAAEALRRLSLRLRRLGHGGRW